MIVSKWLQVFGFALVAGVVSGCVALQPGEDLQPPQPNTHAPPQEVAAYHLVEEGREQLNGGHTESAVATFQKALALAPSSPHANLALAEAKVEQGAFRAALVYCDRVARLVGDDPAWQWRVSLIRGHAFEGSGDVVRAAAEFRRVLDEEPDNAEALEGVARLEALSRVP